MKNNSELNQIKIKRILKRRQIDVQDLHGNKIDINIDTLCITIIKLEKLLQEKEKDLLIKNSGINYLFNEHDFLYNKIFYRDKQLKQLYRRSNKIINYGKKIIKKIIREKNKKIGALKYLDKMKKLNEVNINE